MNNGINVWVNGETGKKVKSATRPAGDYWGPAYPPSRVNGKNYTPYSENSEWEKAANGAMKDAARYNFQNRRK